MPAVLLLRLLRGNAEQKQPREDENTNTKKTNTCSVESSRDAHSYRDLEWKVFRIKVCFKFPKDKNMVRNFIKNRTQIADINILVCIL